MNRNQSGQISIEYLIVIGLVTLFLGMITAWYMTSRKTFNSDNAASSILSIADAARVTYDDVPTGYLGVTSKVLIDNGAVPDFMQRGGNAVVNEFNGTVTFAPVNLYGTNDGLRITYPIERGKACSNFVSKVANHFPIVQADVGGGVLRTIRNATINFAYNPASASVACSADLSGQANLILVAGQ